MPISFKVYKNNKCSHFDKLYFSMGQTNKKRGLQILLFSTSPQEEEAFSLLFLTGIRFA